MSEAGCSVYRESLVLGSVSCCSCLEALHHFQEKVLHLHFTLSPPMDRAFCLLIPSPPQGPTLEPLISPPPESEWD